MSYSIQQLDQCFEIKQKNIHKCVDILNWKLGGGEEKNFQGLSNYFVEWGWTIDSDTEGNVVHCWWEGGSLDEWDIKKISLLATFIEDNCSLTMRGEDNYMWRWLFLEGHMYEQEAELVFPVGCTGKEIVW